jgi:hypothetical protein
LPGQSQAAPVRFWGGPAARVVRISSLCSSERPARAMNKGSSMNTNSGISNVRPTVVAFVKCDDATTCGRMVNLTAQEERQLRNVLAALWDWGLILTASVEPAAPGHGFDDFADHLRRLHRRAIRRSRRRDFCSVLLAGHADPFARAKSARRVRWRSTRSPGGQIDVSKFSAARLLDARPGRPLCVAGDGRPAWIILRKPAPPCSRRSPDGRGSWCSSLLLHEHGESRFAQRVG